MDIIIAFIYGVLSIISVFPSTILGITTIHHDKPESARIAKIANKMTQEVITVPSINLTMLNVERQKRLLPYVNYYLKSNQQHHRQQQQQHHPQKQSYFINPNFISLTRDKFTPFLDSNALPGPFRPMLKSQAPQQIHQYLDEVTTTQKPITISYTQKTIDYDKVPNFSAIYDKLSQLKLVQDSNRYTQQQNYKINPVIPEKHTINFLSTPNYNNQHQYKVVEPSKTIIETYTPTNIDITINNDRPKYKDNFIYEIIQPQTQPPPPPPPPPSITSSKPRPIFILNKYNNYNREHFKETRRPILIYQPKYTHNDNSEKINLQPIEQHIEPKIKPQVVVEDSYVAQKLIPVPVISSTPVTESTPIYEDIYYNTPEPDPITIRPNENTNTLSKILKQLQDANALPHTLTPDNIDNSINTLVKILNSLKKQQSLNKPIVVADESPEILSEEIHETHNEFPDTITQSFPANTIDGGTPGRPGIDYPALSTIPQTSFNCKTQRYKGFFGDPHTNCQVWHYCDLNGGQASFLCPNGTIFSQVALTCDWWYNVKCSSTAQLYVLNERLYKYIIPLAPKFPEDYSGPLVDKYLALKFQEMEEKMKKERKKKVKNDDGEEEHEENVTEEKDDSDQLRDINAENLAKAAAAS